MNTAETLKIYNAYYGGEIDSWKQLKKHIFTGEELHEFIQFAASQLQSAPTEDEWISVNDRLPEESGRYWCYIKELNGLGWSYFQWNCAYSANEKKFSDSTLTNGENVTHWRPLPAPPSISALSEKDKKEDYVASENDLEASDNALSKVPCDAPVNSSNYIDQWIERIINGSTGFKVWEDRECVIFHKGREIGVAEFVIMALANPHCEGADQVLKAISEQRGKQLLNSIEQDKNHSL